MANILIVFAVAFIGSAVQTVVGFGFVILLMAILPLFLPIASCLVVSQLSGVFMSAVLIWGRVSLLDWKKVVFPALFASLGGIAGLLFLGALDNALYMRLLGAILVLLALWMMKFSSLVKLKPSPLSGSIAGGAGGLMGALFGVSAPPLVLYFSTGAEDKDSYVVNLQSTLLIQTGVCLIGRIALGMWPEGAWYLCIPALAGAFLGKFPGKLLYDKLDLKTFKLLVYLFMGILGVYIIVSNSI